MDHVEILTRLGMAAGLGVFVAGLYRWARPQGAGLAGLASTILLLAPLIAMVTMAVGTNVAAAFTLVGTLAIVRFRTAIRDPQDTTYVIFAVAVGVAAGNLSIWVAIWGSVVVALLVIILTLCTKTAWNRPARRVLELVISPADLDAVPWESELARHGGRGTVLESRTNQADQTLSLHIAVLRLPAEQSAPLTVALLAHPEVRSAVCRPARNSE